MFVAVDGRATGIVAAVDTTKEDSITVIQAFRRPGLPRGASAGRLVGAPPSLIATWFHLELGSGTAPGAMALRAPAPAPGRSPGLSDRQPLAAEWGTEGMTKAIVVTLCALVAAAVIAASAVVWLAAGR
jgi:hypothetical protein